VDVATIVSLLDPSSGGAMERAASWEGFFFEARDRKARSWRFSNAQQPDTHRVGESDQEPGLDDSSEAGRDTCQQFRGCETVTVTSPTQAPSPHLRATRPAAP